MSETVDTAVALTKWSSFVDHIRNNRVEYLLLCGVMHILGLTTKAYSQVSGICL
jgi:cobyric acid synthase